MTKPRYNQNVSLTIKSIGANGEGVGYWHGYTLFVDKTLPGEVVRGRLVECQKRYGRVNPLSISEPSPLRVAPACPLYERCGGCQLMHLGYDHQLEAKRQRVLNDFEKFGRMTDVEVKPCIASPNPVAYRNKIQMPVGNSPQGLVFGLYARDSHDLVAIDHCVVHCELGERVYEIVCDILKRSGVRAYDAETGSGELRYLLIKTAVHAQQVLVVLVTHGDASQALVEAAKEMMARCPQVKGVVQNINSGSGNVVLGQEYRTLAGAGSIEETLRGLVFKVSPASFFQVNTLQAENLYDKALDLAGLTGHETVLDAYCGVGTLALLAARRACKVIGVECVAPAIEDAKENAKRNGIVNAHFVCDNAESFVETLEGVDVALLNPPRKGCEASFLEGLGKLKPRTIVYISCDPATLARDLSRLKQHGYQVGSVHPFDMFPHTAHVECVVKLVS